LLAVPRAQNWDVRRQRRWRQRCEGLSDREALCLCAVQRLSPASLLTFMEVSRYPMQNQWLARTLRYWNKLVDLVQHGPSLLGSTFLANVASGLACGKANTWAAELRTALQFVCPDQVWMPHMLQGQPIIIILLHRT
jgi:hypothetical protein